MSRASWGVGVLRPAAAAAAASPRSLADAASWGSCLGGTMEGPGAPTRSRSALRSRPSLCLKGSWFLGKRRQPENEYDAPGANAKGKVFFVASPLPAAAPPSRALSSSASSAISGEDGGCEGGGREADERNTLRMDFKLKATYKHSSWSDMGLQKRKSRVELRGTALEGKVFLDAKGRQVVPLLCTTTHVTLTIVMGRNDRQTFTFSMMEARQLMRLLLAGVLGVQARSLLASVVDIVDQYVDDAYLLLVGKMRQNLARQFSDFTVRVRKKESIVPIPSSVRSFMSTIQGSILQPTGSGGGGAGKVAAGGSVPVRADGSEEETTLPVITRPV
eukprot:CAMPEP_0167798972 /NCGR_PEP_ID=MMETSP0111_2-20121227/16690_1 /TAXON_ID=91324 /ORGANISM="Lotharella globosa, Strain CCCM811" /LENGTH=331 /DNA_ID=CAMNT_0007693615 /DNA_START=65 /DNA_END=1060 /DNA_ORIENTATION=+